MAIGMVKQDGKRVKAYNEVGLHLFTLTGELHGYTAQTVSLKEGKKIKIYNDNGLYVTSNSI